MLYRRERSLCRKTLMHLCQEYDCTLQKLLNIPHLTFSKNLRIQAHKMIDEGCFHSAKELKDFEERVVRSRSLGLIK